MIDLTIRNTTAPLHQKMLLSNKNCATCRAPTPGENVLRNPAACRICDGISLEVQFEYTPINSQVPVVYKIYSTSSITPRYVIKRDCATECRKLHPNENPLRNTKACLLCNGVSTD
jgi:hypothetical protein